MADYSYPDRHLLITCEHAANLVPFSIRHLFAGQEQALASHQAYDPWALTLATGLARCFHAPLYYSTVSRLVVDCNRSPSHCRLFSPLTRSLTEPERHKLLAHFYFPYHAAVRRCVALAAAGGTQVIHVAVHTFTPQLHGRPRNADIGLLYDPARSEERTFCRIWRETLLGLDTSLRVRRNYPYQGRADGLTSMLRRIYRQVEYLGLELEVSQGTIGSRNIPGLHRLIRASLELTLNSRQLV